MSTILKALKKLENEQEIRQSSGARDLPEFNARQAVQQAVKLVRFRGLGLKMGIAAGALGALGTVTYLYLSKPSPLHPPASNSAHEMVRAKTPASAHRPPDHAASHMSKPRTTVSAKAAKAESMVPQRDTKPPDPVAPAIPAEVDATPRVNYSAAQAKTMAKQNRPIFQKEPPATPQRAEVPAGLPQTRPAAQVPRETAAPYAGVDRLTDGRLKVQAIAWAPDAVESLAVINNRIVREGETLEGFAILAIGQDEVVVKEGPKTWKVIFGSP